MTKGKTPEPGVTQKVSRLLAAASPSSSPAGDPAVTALMTSLLPPAKPEVESDPEVERLVDEIREAARKSGMRSDDPLMPLLTAYVKAIRLMAERTARSDQVAEQASRRIIEAIQQAHRAADAETERFKASLSVSESETIRRVADAIAVSAEKALTRRVRVFDRNTAYAAAGVLFAVAASCFGGGYWWGHHAATTSIHETEVGLQAAFADGPDVAQKWLDLMTWNSLPGALAQCTGTSTTIEHGRRECDVPLWTEPRPRTTPNRSP